MALLLVACGCSTDAPVSTQAHIDTGELTKVGVLDFKVAMQGRFFSTLAVLERERHTPLGQTSEKLRDLKGRGETLKDQIAGLPRESILRLEKLRLLAHIRDEMLKEERWYNYILEAKELLASYTRELTEAARVIAQEGGLDLVVFVNRPDVDPLSGELTFEDPNSSIAISNSAHLVEITAKVLTRMTRSNH